MKKIYSIFLLIILCNCSSKDKFDINRYYDLREQDQILTSIIAYISAAPPYTRMEDRFQEKQRAYYSTQTFKFKILKYFVAPDSTHYFYLMRPSSIASEHRGVAGHFKMSKNFLLTDFKEEFVTTVMSETDLTSKAAFLFDELVKGNLDTYIKMNTYIQWPNEVSQYDTIAYQWKLKSGI